MSVLFLLAACAFVADVLSPASPTPQVSGAGSIPVIEPQTLSASGVADLMWGQSELSFTGERQEPYRTKGRSLLSLIYVFLC